MEHLLNWNNLQEDYERLGTQKAVAELYGCNETTVSRAMKRYGLAVNGLCLSKGEHTKEWLVKWANLENDYNRLGTQQAVADEYGVKQRQIDKAMKRLGIKSLSRAGRKNPWTDERRANHKVATNTSSFKESHRVSLLSRFDTLRSSATDSPLEKLLHAALNRAGVSYTTQQVKLGKYAVDIELLQKPVIIEADGFNHRLERQKAKDKIRDANLDEAEYQVFRFTGTEINTDADGCISNVMTITGITPDTNPIADIRRQGVGPDNMNWKGGKAKLVCLHCHAPFESYRSNAKFCNMQCYIIYRKDKQQVVV